jgi:hypothetical protein
MNNIKLWNSSIHTMTNGFIIGCSILTFGMITSTYLNGIINLHVTHKFNQHHIKYDDYYWHHFVFSFLLGISGVSFVAFTFRIPFHNK